MSGKLIDAGSGRFWTSGKAPNATRGREALPIRLVSVAHCSCCMFDSVRFFSDTSKRRDAHKRVKRRAIRAGVPWPSTLWRKMATIARARSRRARPLPATSEASSLFGTLSSFRFTSIRSYHGRHTVPYVTSLGRSRLSGATNERYSACIFPPAPHNRPAHPSIKSLFGCTQHSSSTSTGACKYYRKWHRPACGATLTRSARGSPVTSPLATPPRSTASTRRPPRGACVRRAARRARPRACARWRR